MFNDELHRLELAGGVEQRRDPRVPGLQVAGEVNAKPVELRPDLGQLTKPAEGAGERIGINGVVENQLTELRPAGAPWPGQDAGARSSARALETGEHLQLQPCRSKGRLLSRSSFSPTPPPLPSGVCRGRTRRAGAAPLGAAAGETRRRPDRSRMACQLHLQGAREVQSAEMERKTE